MDRIACRAIDELLTLATLKCTYPTVTAFQVVHKFDGTKDKGLVKVQPNHIKSIDTAAKEKLLITSWSHEIFHLLLEVQSFILTAVYNDRVGCK